MNEAELRQAVESMRAQIAALSGRIDGLDRGEILRGVNDGRRDKLAERHAQAFGRHSGDGVAHHYRDYVNPHRIPGMKEVRVFEAAGAGVVIASMKTSAGGSNTLTLNTKILEDDSSVIECDTTNYKFNIKADGRYFIGLHANVNMLLQYGYAGSSTTSVSIWKNNSRIYEGGGIDMAMNVGTTGNSIRFPVFASAGLPTVLASGDTIRGMVELTWYAGASMYVIKLS